MYRTMPLQIVDAGCGLAGRFCWAAAGAPTVHEAIYPETVAWLKRDSPVSTKLQNRWPSPWISTGC